MFKNKFLLDIAKCSLCQTCMLTCPRKALNFTKEGMVGKITLNHSLCRYPCQVCQINCPNNAIKITKKWFFTYFPPKKERWIVNYENCKECGTLIEPRGSGLCLQCRRKIASRRQQKNNTILRAKG